MSPDTATVLLGLAALAMAVGCVAIALRAAAAPSPVRHRAGPEQPPTHTPAEEAPDAR